MTEKEFTGKTALVTGGSRGIGRAISLKLASAGANIAINYMSRDADAVATKQAVEKEGVRCVLVKGDISSPEAMASVTARTREALGPISLLVANAACAKPGQPVAL